MTRVIESPAYTEESSLSGDFGDLAGILDWAKEGVSTIWGGVKEGAEAAASRIWQPISERIIGPGELPSADPGVSPQWDPSAPATLPVAPAAAVPLWVWLLGAGAVFWFLKK